MTIRVSVIDKHPLMLEAVKLLLETDGEIEVVVRSPSVEDFLAEAKDRGVIIDVLLLDLILPGLSGPEAVAYLTEQGYKVVVLTAVDDRRTMAQVIQAGANGYILKTASVAEIRDAVMTVATGQMEAAAWAIRSGAQASKP